MSEYARHDQPFGDDEVKQILRRAVELDASLGAPLSPEILRSIARESGISGDAVDRAIMEQRLLRTRTDGTVHGVFAKVQRWLTTPVAELLTPRSLLDSVVRSAGALGITWFVVWTSIEIARRLPVFYFEDGVRLLWAPEALGLLIGAGIAERFRARAVTVVLLGLGSGLGARFIVEVLTGGRSAMDQAGKIALLAAGVLGVLLGILLAKQRGARSVSDTLNARRPEPAAQPAPDASLRREQPTRQSENGLTVRLGSVRG